MTMVNIVKSYRYTNGDAAAAASREYLHWFPNIWKSDVYFCLEGNFEWQVIFNEAKTMSADPVCTVRKMKTKVKKYSCGTDLVYHNEKFGRLCTTKDITRTTTLPCKRLKEILSERVKYYRFC